MTQRGKVAGSANRAFLRHYRNNIVFNMPNDALYRM